MVIEMLERRQLLSATANVVGDHVLVVQLDNSGENILVQEPFTDSHSALVVESFPTGGNVYAFDGIKAIVILGGSGNDTINALIKDVPVFIDGGSGNDTIGVVADVFDPANDTFGAGSVIMGGNDDDTIVIGGLSNATVLGGNGNDSVIAGGFILSSGTETTTAGGNAVVIDGGNGSDSLQSGVFQQLSALTDSSIMGGNGSDTIVDLGSTNTVDGGNGSDTITVVNGDVVVNSNGHDVVTRV